MQQTAVVRMSKDMFCGIMWRAQSSWKKAGLELLHISYWQPNIAKEDPVFVDVLPSQKSQFPLVC